GGGSNAIGIFSAFIPDRGVRLVGVEAGGRGVRLGDHAARFHGGAPGVLQGTYSYVLQDAAGQIATTHSVSAGLDYPGEWGRSTPGSRNKGAPNTFPRRIRKRWRHARCWHARRVSFRRWSRRTRWRSALSARRR